jgi:hypothetical protein
LCHAGVLTELLNIYFTTEGLSCMLSPKSFARPGDRAADAGGGAVAIGEGHKSGPDPLDDQVAEGEAHIVPLRKTYDVRLKKAPLEQAQRIARRGHVTEGDAVRRALAVLDFLEDEIEKGAILRIQRPDGEIERLQIIYS